MFFPAKGKAHSKVRLGPRGRERNPGPRSLDRVSRVHLSKFVRENTERRELSDSASSSAPLFGQTPGVERGALARRWRAGTVRPSCEAHPRGRGTTCTWEPGGDRTASMEEERKGGGAEATWGSTEDVPRRPNETTKDVVDETHLRERTQALLQEADLQTTTGACQMEGMPSG